MNRINQADTDTKSFKNKKSSWSFAFNPIKPDPKNDGQKILNF